MENHKKSDKLGRMEGAQSQSSIRRLIGKTFTVRWYYLAAVCVLTGMGHEAPRRLGQLEK